MAIRKYWEIAPPQMSASPIGARVQVARRTIERMWAAPLVFAAGSQGPDVLTRPTRRTPFQGGAKNPATSASGPGGSSRRWPSHKTRVSIAPASPRLRQIITRRSASRMR